MSKQPPRIFDAPNGFVFHHLNAWEQNEQVILESIFYNDFPSIGPQENFREINFDDLPDYFVPGKHQIVEINEDYTFNGKYFKNIEAIGTFPPIINLKKAIKEDDKRKTIQCVMFL